MKRKGIQRDIKKSDDEQDQEFRRMRMAAIWQTEDTMQR
jgi:hypothetical protein